jgi:hypothetical protein
VGEEAVSKAAGFGRGVERWLDEQPAAADPTAAIAHIAYVSLRDIMYLYYRPTI